jgi:hypothetical protein
MTFDDLSFEPPATWRDRRLLVFAPPAAEEASAHIIVTRRRRAPGVPLDVFVCREIVNLSARLPMCELLGQDETRVADRPAIMVTLRTVHGPPGILMDEVLVYVDSPDGDVLTLTCAGAHPADDEALAALDDVLASARLVAPALERSVRDPP